MKFYRTKFTTADEKAIEGYGPYCLPMMPCPECGNSRGKAGIIYPDLDIPSIFPMDLASRLKTRRAQKFTWEEFKDVVAQLKPAVRDNILPPAANFGLFTGKAYKKPGLTDFIMPEACILLARRKVAEALNAIGNHLQLFPAKIERLPESEEYVQIWAPPLAISAPSAGIKWCATCERGSVATTECLLESSVPSGAEVFVVKDCPHFIVLTEQLVSDISAVGAKGLALEELPSE